MTDALVLLTLLALILMVIAFRQKKHIESLQEAKKLFLNVLPLLLLAFIMAGFIDLLLPEEMLQAWMGKGSGWKGLIIGPAVGALVQGGPFAFFPLFDTVFRGSISTGATVAMISAWGMINVGHLPYELSFLGPRFVALKYGVYLFMPSLAGLLAELIFG